MNSRQQLFVDFLCSGMSAKEAYTKAGYNPKNAGENAYHLRKNTNINEIINIRQAERSQNSDDKLAFGEEKAIDKLLEIIDLPITKENLPSIIKACQDVVDRTKGKPAQNVNIGGQENNPVGVALISPAGKREEIDDDPE